MSVQKKLGMLKKIISQNQVLRQMRSNQHRQNPSEVINFNFARSFKRNFKGAITGGDTHNLDFLAVADQPSVFDFIE